MTRLLSLLLLSLFVCLTSAGCSDGGDDTAPGDAGDPFVRLHYRIVWVQDAGENRDVFCQGRRLLLMVLDSLDRRGERPVIVGTGSFIKPLLNSDASTIIYTARDAQGDLSVWRVNWDGSGKARFAAGRALDIWLDPATGREWVHYQKNPVSGSSADSGTLYRQDLNSRAGEEEIWPEKNKNIALSRDSLQLSADGSMAAGLFPWPRAGTVRMTEGRITLYGRGCWTSLAPDNSYIFWFFQDNHRRVSMVDTLTGRRWQVDMSGAALIAGHEVYHPRWSNHRQYLVLSGPYTIMHGGNAIRGGGAGIEILIGRFNTGLTEVERWLRVTDNPRADFFPDLWIDPQTIPAR